MNKMFNVACIFKNEYSINMQNTFLYKLGLYTFCLYQKLRKIKKKMKKLKFI